MAQNSRVTIKDVARLAGVSPGTVSNALSGKRPVLPTTRQKILDAIAELDYHPNLLARSLVNRQSSALAVVTAGLEYYGPVRTLIGIERQANEFGYSLQLTLLHRPNEEDVQSILTELMARRVDGIIWAVHQIGNNHDWIDMERLRTLPPIVFLTMAAMPGVSVVAPDNMKGGRMATTHLLNQGYRKIGLITGPMAWWEAQQRRAGWRAALASAEIEIDPTLIAEGDWSAASGERALHKLLAHHPAIEAIFVSNDEMAMGALRAAHAMGLRIPDDLALVGFDNTLESAYYWPSLTSVRPRLIDVGKCAVQEVQRMIEARGQDRIDDEAVTIRLLPELIVRESSIGRDSMIRT